MRRGVYGRLESTVPAITVPAWASMMTGLDPGQLGFYGFRNRSDYSYEQMSITNASDVHHPRVWDRLSEAGHRVAVIGVPQTYPVRPVNGHLVSCFLTPGPQSEYTHPPELKGEIAEWLGGSDQFLVDVPGFRSEDKDRILADIYRMADQHFDLCRRLLAKEGYDFSMMVDMGLDRIHHAFWKYMDPDHPGHEPGSRFASAIHDYSVYIDGKIGELLEAAGEGTVVAIVSDHGSQAMAGGVCINEWLIREGYLVLKDRPANLAPLERCEVDWTRTRAWSSGGYYARVFLNVEGREPDGIIPAADFDRERDELSRRLAEITDPDGHPIGVRAYKPEELYRETKNIPPDLIVYFGDLTWRAVGSIGFDSIWTFENDTGPDDANHAQHGIFIWYDPRRPGNGQELEGLRIYDVAATALALFGEEPIPGGHGRVIDWEAAT